ncbi:peroxiredoxin [Pseudomonas sp. PH1b]|uniref:peroxiredoxin n=1 Tax=Pseudomonas sp. PH1b TaxID=1397282 RepID=UPI00046ACC8B|nr:peroxiredoxin [Pseudomonas sp. PH1b]
MRDMLSVDWSRIPAPQDDGAARHLQGLHLPRLLLPSTSGAAVDLSALPGRTLVYVYPRMGRPDLPLLEGWDMTPGARGCTPQSCGFRDLTQELAAAGVDKLFGLSNQDSAYQREAVERLHLPFALLSDAQGQLSEALALPVFELNGSRFLKRLTLILKRGRVEQLFYPVFPPDQNARQVLAWLQAQG